MQKIKGKKKVEKKTRKKGLNRWIVFGVIGVFGVFGVVAGLIYSYLSLGLEGVTFSLESGFYNDDVYLEIKPRGTLLAQPIAIKYNMNGDDLEDTSELYNGSIKLEVPEEGYTLYTITAVACKGDEECTDSEVATYVLGKDLDEDVTIDIVNINSSQKNLYDYDIGIMVGGRTYDENETVDNRGYIGGNYNNRGKGWMREAYITRFDTGGGLVWDQNVYMGISGGTSAAFDVKSIKISMNTQDEENNLETFRLRSGSQDQFSGNIRSSVVNRLVEESRFDGGAGSRRMVVFLNGEYYGIFDLQNSFSERNLSKKFGLTKKKNIEKNRGSEKSVFESFGIDEWYWDDLDLSENRARIEELIDTDNYLKYYAIFILVNNTDWPMNNFEAWRYNNGEPIINKYEDGRIRFLIRDTDLVYYTDGNIEWFKSAIGDIFEYLMENKYNGNGSSFRKVMESKYYRQEFIDLLRELLDGPFATENVLKIIDEEAAKIEHQVKLFSFEEGHKAWVEQIELMKKAVSKRENEIRADVKKYFDIEL